MVGQLFFLATMAATINPSNATNRTAFAHLNFTFSKTFFAWTLKSRYLLRADLSIHHDSFANLDEVVRSSNDS